MSKYETTEPHDGSYETTVPHNSGYETTVPDAAIDQCTDLKQLERLHLQLTSQLRDVDRALNFVRARKAVLLKSAENG